MSFIKPLITTIQTVSSNWYYSVCRDGRYNGLMRTLNISAPIAPTADRYMVYRAHMYKGDGTPGQLVYLRCSDNMRGYRQSVLPPSFSYNAAVFPPYENTKHHWCIRTSGPSRHVSLITDSKEEICNYIDNTSDNELHFVPLPDTLQ